MDILVNGKTHHAAKEPEFKALDVNESRFAYDERFKEYGIDFNPDGVSHVEWLTQRADTPSPEWKAEIKRAFIANGAKPGHRIEVNFGSRDEGLTRYFVLEV